MPVAPPQRRLQEAFSAVPEFAATPLHDGPPNPMIVLRTSRMAAGQV